MKLSPDAERYLSRAMHTRWSWDNTRHFLTKEIGIQLTVFRSTKETWPVEWSFDIHLWNRHLRIYRIEETRFW